MSDLSIYELDDIIWDDFEHNGDHIVPNPSDDQGGDNKCEGGNSKKPRSEVAPHPNNEGNIPSMQSVNTKNCADEGTVQNASGYPPNHISQSDNLNLFSSDGNNKESNGHLYYGWPDIGNFEDVDTLLSNCDSSFGLGVTGNGDELVWFTSEDLSGGYEEAIKMDLKFPCSQPNGLTNISQEHESLETDNKCLGHDSVMKSTYLHQDRDNVPMKTTDDSLITDIKSETSGPTTPSGKDFCNAFQPSTSRSDMVSSQNQFGKENESQSQSDVELDLSNVQEGSSISSELDKISLEASTLRQLQQVMEQLDLRTKLCIRDSLYRLARSAEQRHNHAGMSDITTNCGATGGPLITEGTNKYSGLMDMETDTNPIDRTIAHLLFHRPSDSSNRATHVPLKHNVKVHGSTSGPSVVANKLSCQELENESDDKISSTRKN